MWTSLRPALIRSCKALLRWGGSVSGRIGQLTPTRQRREDDRREDARARFWADVRDGQNEAERNSARRNP